MEQLSYIDEHSVRIDAPRERVWVVLRDYVGAVLQNAERSPVTAILGTQPRAGFAVGETQDGKSLSLVGSHRFSRYELLFELADSRDGGTQLRAQTYANFPGLRGRVYRALVIGTRGHVLATRCLLRSVQRWSISSLA